MGGSGLCGEDAVERGPADAEQLRGAQLISASPREDSHHVISDRLVEVEVVIGVAFAASIWLDLACSRSQWRQIDRPEPLAFRLECGGADGLLKFSDVAWPGMAEQRGDGSRPEPADWLAVNPGEALDENLG